VIKLLALLLSGVKLGKLFSTGGTMLISVVMYSFVFGWRYAVGFVAMLFIHEMGHFLAARQRGLQAGLPMFIPFVGAWTTLKDMPHNAETDAYIAMGGPLLGTLAALVCYFVARNENSNLLLAIAYSGFFLNLINLIPIMPLDGGHITQVISPWLWAAGVPLLGLLIWWNQSPVLIMVAVLAGMQLWSAWKHRHDPQQQAYRIASMETRIGYATCYIALVGFLGIMAHDVHEMLRAPMVSPSGTV
jgi:Zn-dependent protease